MVQYCSKMARVVHSALLRMSDGLHRTRPDILVEVLQMIEVNAAQAQCFSPSRKIHTCRPAFTDSRLMMANANPYIASPACQPVANDNGRYRQSVEVGGDNGLTASTALETPN